MSEITHSGGCHCGRVRFEVDAPGEIIATRCNCSVCTMTGFLHLIIGQEAVCTGAIAATKSEDYVVGTYREHGHAYAKGMSARAIMAEL